MDIGRISFPLGADRPVKVAMDTLMAMAPQVVEFVRGGQTEELQALLSGSDIPRRHHYEAIKQMVLGVSLNQLVDLIFRETPLAKVIPPVEKDTIDTMAELLHYSLEEGIREVLRMIDEISKNKPDIGSILIAVYGWPDSGKSYFMDQVRAALKQKNISCSRTTGAPRSSDFESIASTPSLFSKVLMLHCAWARDNRNARWMRHQQHEDPNLLAARYGLAVHVNIGVYDPKVRPPPLGDYDLVVRNLGAARKNP